MRDVTELLDRRQRARVAYYDAITGPGQEGSAIALEESIETATRVQITPELIEALARGMGLVSTGNRGEPTLRAVFEAAGFEVEP